MSGNSTRALMGLSRMTKSTHAGNGMCACGLCLTANAALDLEGASLRQSPTDAADYLLHCRLATAELLNQRVQSVLWDEDMAQLSFPQQAQHRAKISCVSSAGHYSCR